MTYDIGKDVRELEMRVEQIERVLSSLVQESNESGDKGKKVRE